MFMAFTWSPDTVWLLLQKAWWFLVVLGVLVAFHELGHFLAARWVGVKVLKFSLGFGPKLFGRKMGETEYLLSAIPLGGYVKLFGEDETEATTQEDRTRSFAHQRLWGKVLIVAAGPGFNFILAYFIFAGWLATGTPLFVPTFQDLTPDIEAMVPGSPADTAGIQIGDRVSRINGQDISTRSELFDAVSKSKGQPLTLEIKRGEQVKTLTVTPTTAPGPRASAQEPGYYLGVEETPPLVTSVMQSSPAAKAGLQAGDHVVDIEGQTIHTWSQMTGIVKESPNLPLKVEVLREGHRVSLTVTPSAEKTMVNGQSIEVGAVVGGWTLLGIEGGNLARFKDPEGAVQIYPIGEGDLAVAQTPSAPGAAPTAPSPMPKLPPGVLPRLPQSGAQPMAPGIQPPPQPVVGNRRPKPVAPQKPPPELPPLIPVPKK